MGGLFTGAIVYILMDLLLDKAANESPRVEGRNPDDVKPAAASIPETKTEATVSGMAVLVGTVLDGLVSGRGWKAPVAVGSVLARWDDLVGPGIAGHCRPESFDETVVRVRCDSTAYAANLRLMVPQLLRMFDEHLGEGIVTRIEILGPTAPSWKRGRRSVQGRGPRDTYG